MICPAMRPIRALLLLLLLCTVPGGLAPALAQQPGCTDSNALNFDPLATVDDGSCLYGIQGCTDPAALNYDPVATVDNGSCVYVFYGCTDPNAANYNPVANADDGSCYYYYYGCTDPGAYNYDPNANWDDGSCQYYTYGCTDPTADNYDPTAYYDDGSCYYGGTSGCTDPNAANYDPWANYEDGSCYYYYYGCTDAAALNYDPSANYDDGSCQFYYDCQGELNGVAYMDECGTCVDGNTGLEPCVVTGVSGAPQGGVALYPNPTSEDLWLLLPTDVAGDATVRLTDPSGREVMRQEVRVVSGVATRIPMEVQDGTYVLHFLSHRDGHAVARAVVRHSTGPRP
jgi:hypothetical protein